MIYSRFIVTDQSYEVSCRDKNLFYFPRGLAVLLRGDRENKSLRENRRVKMFAVAGSRLRCFYFLASKGDYFPDFFQYVFICNKTFMICLRKINCTENEKTELISVFPADLFSFALIFLLRKVASRLIDSHAPVFCNVN